jgi:hypothetical protein
MEHKRAIEKAGDDRHGDLSDTQDSRTLWRTTSAPVRWKPFPAFPVVFRRGNQHIHVTGWTGEKRTEKPTTDCENTTWRVNEGERAA